MRSQSESNSGTDVPSSGRMNFLRRLNQILTRSSSETDAQRSGRINLFRRLNQSTANFFSRIDRNITTRNRNRRGNNAFIY